MTPDQHLATLGLEGGRLAAMPVDALAAPVPSVEGWTLEHVVRHTGRVHRWVTALLGAPLDTDVAAVAGSVEGLPRGADCLPAYREALDGVLDAFAGRDPREPTPSFVGAADVRFWARRQALEVTVHRVDAADAVHAAGGSAPDAVLPATAADGVDEWARVFVATRWPQRFGPYPEALRGRTFHLHGTDEPAPPDGAEWLLSFAADGGSCRVEATHAKGDVALRGPAEALLLAAWRRRPLEALDVIGDAPLAAAFHDALRF